MPFEERDRQGIMSFLGSGEWSLITPDMLGEVIKRIRESEGIYAFVKQPFHEWVGAQNNTTFLAQWTDIIKVVQAEFEEKDTAGIKDYLGTDATEEQIRDMRYVINRFRFENPAFRDQNFESWDLKDSDLNERFMLTLNAFKAAKEAELARVAAAHKGSVEVKVGSRAPTNEEENTFRRVGVEQVQNNDLKNKSPTDQISGNLQTPGFNARQGGGTGVEYSFPERQDQNKDPDQEDQNEAKTGTEFTFPKSFPSTSSTYGAHNYPKILTFTRSWYSKGDNDVWYPNSFGKARTALYGSDEYMRTFGVFLQEFNPANGYLPSRQELTEALKDLQEKPVNYPFGQGLNDILLGEVAVQDPNHPNDPNKTITIPKRPAFVQYLRAIRLAQYGRHAYPYGYELEDTSLIEGRLNKFGFGTRNRAEMIAAVENALIYMGTACVEEKDKNGHPNGNYSITRDNKPIIKVIVPKGEGMITFQLLEGAEEDKDANLRLFVFNHAQHVQWNQSTVFNFHPGSDIYENIRILQLALYDHNFRIEMTKPETDELEAQITELKKKGVDVTDLEAELKYLMENFGAFDGKLHYSGTRSVASGNPLTLNEQIDEFQERSKQVVPKLFPPKDPAKLKQKAGSSNTSPALGGNGASIRRIKP